MKFQLNRRIASRLATSHFFAVPTVVALATLSALALTVPAQAQVNPSALVDGLENLVGGKQAGFKRSGSGFKGLSDEELKSKPDNFAFDELRQRVAAGAVEFNFKLQLAQPGDVLNSATVPLPADRKQVTVGRLRITAVEAGEGGACEKVTFIPTLLPKGIEASDDPMLQARAAPYAVSLGRRLSEGK